MELKKKIESILLVEDDEATIFLHQTIIEHSDFVEKVVIARDGEEAIALLTEKIDGEYLRPSLIFLDINMPKMNGWEFLEAYKQLYQDQLAQVVIVMLTTSLNPTDKKRSEAIAEVNGFMNKPLSISSLEKMINDYFPSNLADSSS